MLSIIFALTWIYGVYKTPRLWFDIQEHRWTTCETNEKIHILWELLTVPIFNAFTRGK